MSEENTRVEIGKKLRDARVSMGYTLDDLQQATKIQKRYLIAIEDEKFKELPGDFYVRAFIKQYADTVGLDGDELLKEYNDLLPQSKSSEYSEHMSQAIETRAGQRKNTDSLDRVRQYLPTIAIGVIIVVILGAIWMTALHGHKSSSNSNSIDSSSVSVSGESSKKSSSKKASSSTSAKSTSKKSSSKVKVAATTQSASAAVFDVTTASQSGKLSLKLTPTQRAWVSVTTDGTTQLSQTMTANKAQTVRVSASAKKVVLSLGNARYTTLTVNGKKIDVTKNGQYPNVRKVTLNLNGSSTATSSSSSASSN